MMPWYLFSVFSPDGSSREAGSTNLPDDDAARPESIDNAATADPAVAPGISDSAGPGAAAEPGHPRPALGRLVIQSVVEGNSVVVTTDNYGRRESAV